MKIFNYSIEQIRNVDGEFELDDKDVYDYLIKLFGKDNIPTLTPVLYNYIIGLLTKRNKLTNPKSKFTRTSNANIYNFSLAKTNVFLKGVQLLKDNKESLEVIKNYANLVLNVQQEVENLHVQHVTETIQTITDTDSEKLLLYVSENDSKVRPDHKKAHDVCLPASDPFWNVSFKLLSSFNCRCTIINAPANSKMKQAPNLVLKETGEASEIDLESGKAILFKQDLEVFKNTDPVVRRQFKKVGIR